MFNFLPELDFSVFETLEHFEAIIRRDFEEKVRSEGDIVSALDAGRYARRYELLRDLALHLFWVNRYAMTMYDKRATRWHDVPKRRDDVFLALVEPWDPWPIAAVIEAGYRALGRTWDERTEDVICGLLLEVFRARRGVGVEIQALNPTVPTALARPEAFVHRLQHYAPDYPGYREGDHPAPARPGGPAIPAPGLGRVASAAARAPGAAPITAPAGAAGGRARAFLGDATAGSARGGQGRTGAPFERRACSSVTARPRSSWARRRRERHLMWNCSRPMRAGR